MSLLVDAINGLNDVSIPTMTKISFAIGVYEIRQQFNHPMNYLDITQQFLGLHQLYTRIVHPAFCSSFNYIVNNDTYEDMGAALTRLQMYNRFPEIYNDVVATIKHRIWETKNAVRKNHINGHLDDEILRLCLIIFRTVVEETTTALFEMIEDLRRKNENIVGFTIVDHVSAETDNPMNPNELYINLTTGTVIE